MRRLLPGRLPCLNWELEPWLLCCRSPECLYADPGQHVDRGVADRPAWPGPLSDTIVWQYFDLMIIVLQVTWVFVCRSQATCGWRCGRSPGPPSEPIVWRYLDLVIIVLQVIWVFVCRSWATCGWRCVPARCQKRLFDDTKDPGQHVGWGVADRPLSETIVWRY